MEKPKKPYRSWQEALGALVKEKGLEDTDLGDIAERALSPVTDRDLLEEASFIMLEQLRRIEVLKAEIHRLKIAAAEIEAPVAT